ncbi:MAG: IS5 family transposase, partial [Saprospiraceae bacterium]
AVESNINELEHRGLDRCPDRGYKNYKRYISLGICAYNLHKVGKELQRQKVAAAKKLRGKAA